MHVAKHVCTYAYIHVCTHVCTHTHKDMDTHVYTHVYAHVCIQGAAEYEISAESQGFDAEKVAQQFAGQQKAAQDLVALHRARELAAKQNAATAEDVAHRTLAALHQQHEATPLHARVQASRVQCAASVHAHS